MAIECNSIIPEAQALQLRFKKCKTLSALDMRKILDLIISLKICAVQGINGEDGNDGLDGLSAYQQALNNGFVGTESEWIVSLKGLPGEKGDDGGPGVPGVAGPIGNGISSITKIDTSGLVDTYSITYTNRLTTNFSVKNGENGFPGIDGIDGYSAYGIAVINGYVGTEVDWLISLKGTDGTNGTNGVDGSNGLDSSNNLQRDEVISFTLVDADNNFVIQLKNVTDIVITIPALGLRDKFNCGFSRLGTGEVSFVTESGVSLINALNGFKINRVGDPTYIERDGNNQSYILYGNTKI